MARTPQYSEYNVATVKPDADGTNARFSTAGASPDAFGASVAQADQALGKSVEKVADVLATHAIKFQEEENETLVNERSTDFMVKLGELETEFQSKQGRDPINSYGEHQQKITALRKQMRDALPNPSAQKRFDNSTMRSMTYALTRGASHAAAENKKYRAAAQRATTELKINEAGRGDNSENQFETIMTETETDIRGREELRGQPPELVDLEVMKARGRAADNWLSAKAATDPETAKRLFEKKRGTMPAETEQRLDKLIKSQIVAKVAPRLAEGLITGGPTESVADRERYAMNSVGAVYGKNAAAGVVGNLVHESGGQLQTDREWSDPSQSGQPGTSGGIASWRNERLAELKKWSEKQGLDHKEFKTQIRFLQYDLAKPKYAELRAQLRAAKTPEEAALAFAKVYEVPATGPDGRPLAQADRDKHAARLAGMELGPAAINPDQGPGARERAENQAKREARAYAQANNLDTDTARAFEDAMVSRVTQGYVKAQADYRDARLSDRYGVQSVLFDPENTPKSLEELFKKGGREVEEAYHRLNATEQGSIRSRLKTNARMTPETDEQNERFIELFGMAHSPDQRREFLDMDLAQEGISERQAMQLGKLQKTLLGKLAEPPQVMKYFNHLKNKGVFTGVKQLEEPTSQKNRKYANHYLGAFAQAIELERQQKGGNLSTEDVERVGRSVLADTTRMAGFIWKKQVVDPETSQATAAAKAALPSIPQISQDNIKAKFQKQWNREPTPLEIISIYRKKENRDKFRALEKKARESARAAPPPPPI